jgi:hypothetical protein
MDSKRNQLSFRVEDEFTNQVEAAAKAEDLAVADFVRKVFRWGFAEYQRAGSLHTLRSHVVERQVAIEKEVYERLKPKPKDSGKK